MKISKSHYLYTERELLAALAAVEVGETVAFDYRTIEFTVTREGNYREIKLEDLGLLCYSGTLRSQIQVIRDMSFLAVIDAQGEDF